MKQHDAKVPFAGGGVFRSVLLLLTLLTFGTNVSWGEDYSGVYYIGGPDYNEANTTSNYYLCPTEEWYYYISESPYHLQHSDNPNNDNGQPFMTTYRCRDGNYVATKAVWIVEKQSNGYYHIKRKLDGKYLTYNGVMVGTGTNNKGRMRVHLEATADGDNALFTLTKTSGYYNIITKNSGPDNVNRKYLNVTDGNKPSLKASGKGDGPNNINVGGIIGLWTSGTENTSKWYFEIPEPTYYVNSNGSEISVSGGGEVFYTTNGDDPVVPNTGDVTEPTKKLSKNPISIEGDDPISIKLIATSKDGTIKSSNIVNFVYNPEMDLDETSFVYNGTAQSPHITSTSITINGEEKPISDFVIGAKNNVNAGTATVTLWDKTNNIYVEKPFTIAPRETELNWGITELEYSGSPQVPSVEIVNLVDGDDCSVIVDGAQTAVSEDYYSATVVGLTGADNDNYTLPEDATQLPKSFRIIPKSLGQVDGITPAEGITVSKNDGDPVSFTVKHGGVTLEPGEDKDYTVEDDEENHMWIIRGQGNYTGSVKVMSLTLSFDDTGEAIGQNMHDVTPHKAPADMTISGEDAPSGLDAYIVTYINMTRHAVTIKKINYVKKEEPLLLLSDLTGTTGIYTATPIYVAEADVTDTSDNLLKISTPGQTVDFGQVYIYDQGKFIMTTAGTLPENTFYLERTPGSSVSSAPLHIVIDDMTDVEDVRWMMDEGRDDKWYAIDGRRLIGKPTKKGLYIKNGHKVVIK